MRLAVICSRRCSEKRGIRVLQHGNGEWLMDIKYMAAGLLGKLTAGLMRMLRRGGTALPGLIATAIDSDILKKVAPHFTQAVILVTGTNGKTTIANLLGNIVKTDGSSWLHNHAGSNLERGIVSTLLKSASISGKPKTDIDFGIFECDEGALLDVAPQFDHPILLFNNLFRDQLDRYGEVETVRQNWINLIQTLKNDPTIILNADDPGVRSLGDYIANRGNVLYFGICDGYTPVQAETDALYYASDFVRCPVCGEELVYSTKFFSHLGDYYCQNCGFTRPARDICLNNAHGNELEIRLPDGLAHIKTPLQGLFNAYNVLAATAASLTAGINLHAIKHGVKGFTPVFGRQERVEFRGKTLIISLVKNPAGFTEVLKSLFQDETEITAAFVLNDNIADGMDVSWIWDVALTPLKNKPAAIIVGGTRAYDMAIRLKYEEVGDSTHFTVCNTPACVLDSAARQPAPSIHIFLTYTALLGLEHELSKRGYKKYWEA